MESSADKLAALGVPLLLLLLLLLLYGKLARLAALLLLLLAAEAAFAVDCFDFLLFDLAGCSCFLLAFEPCSEFEVADKVDICDDLTLLFPRAVDVFVFVSRSILA